MQKPVAEFDRLAILSKDLDDDDPSEFVAGQSLALGKFIERLLGQPLIRAVVHSKTEQLIIERSRNGFSAKRQKSG